MSYSITKNGKELDPKLYTIDEENKTFSSKESDLVLDFSNEYGWSFNTGSYCTFKTGYSCTFKTRSYCTFYTLDNCTFNTGSDCTFYTLNNCTFNVYDDLKINLVKDSCILLIKDDKTEILDLNYFIEKNPSLKGFQIKIDSKEDLNFLSNLKTNNDFMLNLRKPNVKNFLDFINNKQSRSQ
jgi:hypothetical protein